MSALVKFSKLLDDRLVPEFCSDIGRGLTISGFVDKSNRLSEEDAEDFLRAWDTGLLSHKGRGLYIVGTTRVHEQFFWTGSKTASPRTFTLWMEPIISMGAIARLHLDHRWPASYLAAQSPDWAYDIIAIRADGATAIVGEVKKTRREVDDLFDLMMQFGANPDAALPASGKSRNAFKKVMSLRKFPAPLLWLIGTSRYEMVFHVRYSGALVSFDPAPQNALLFNG